MPRPDDQKAFLLLLAAVTILFGWVLLPLFSAVLWGTVIALLFAPLFRRLRRAMGGRANLAALATLGIIVATVIVPLALIGAALTQEALELYNRIKSGELNIGQFFQQARDAAPSWVEGLLQRFGLTSFDAVQERISGGLLAGSQAIATQAFSIGQTTFDFLLNLFVMLYLLFFLLRDGDKLSARIREAVPLRPDRRRALIAKFVTVTRATVKGGMLVALAQGALGGLIFWVLGIGAPVLWAVVMAFVSLLPGIGAAVVWLPVAIYLLATGAVWQGVTLILFGALVIGLVDNFLRPYLIGKDTKMPDYVVLISTLGGIASFGLNGFVIGPVIAALFMAAWGIYTTARKNGEGAAG
ncbi:MAG: AI-2E family transporter [Pseudolabrys sp.]|nr:AI-2E family transporter [Pseudolabrys sp.]